MLCIDDGEAGDQGNAWEGTPVSNKDNFALGTQIS